MPDSIHKLAEYFAQFPGIGPRQASRFVYFLLRKDKSFVERLAGELKKLHGAVSMCSSCYRFYEDDHSGNTQCAVCSSTKRDNTLLLVVEKDADLDTIENTHLYTGKYFVLGGTVPLVESESGKFIRLKLLLERVSGEKGLKEIILALSATPEGDHTTDFVKQALTSLSEKHGFIVSILGRGLSTGSELEYADPETVRNALEHRT